LCGIVVVQQHRPGLYRPHHHYRRRRQYVRLGTAVGVALLIVLSYPFYLLYRRKNKRKQGKTEEGDADIEAEESSAGA